MIAFGLRLAVASGREALIRFVVIAAAVTLGVGLLLATVAGVSALDAQFGRAGWLNPQPVAGAQSADPLGWASRQDFFAGKPVHRIDVAVTGPDSPRIPGIPAPPAPGEYYVSPALRGLMAANPADQLADRYPGRDAGTIGDEALPSPDYLVIVVGRTADEVAGTSHSRRVTSISTDAPAVPIAALDLVLSVVGAGLLFPVLIFIGTATRLSAARREQRFAAMRLVGATPRQISVLAAAEATAAAVLGTALGFALFPPLRALIARYPFTGMRFFPGDLSFGWLAAVIVALGVPAAAAVVARLALRRVRITPLGVARRVTPKPPRAWRLIPLVAGLAELAYFIGRVPETSNGQTAAFLPGFVVVMVGLVLAGPWLTMVCARLLARRSRRLPTLVAARRLADNPQTAFRAISGVVLGLFVTSVATGVITTIVDNRGVQVSALSAATLVQQFGRDGGTVPEGLLTDLRSTPGVGFVTVLHNNPVNTPQTLSSVITCAELARAPQYGRCADGATVAEIWFNLIGFRRGYQGDGAATVWPTSQVTPAQLDRLPIGSLVMGTDGARGTLERTRTLLAHAYPDVEFGAGTQADYEGNSSTQLNQFQQLANAVMLFSLPIAGCSLAVSVAAGISDRKRPFSLLRLTGVPLRMLRRVVALESAVPLLAAAAVATGTGFLAAQLFLKAQMDYDLSAPSPTFCLLAGLGILVSLGIIASTLPLLERVTGPETARNE